MKSKNIWDVILGIIILLTVIISIMEPNAEKFGLKPEWISIASLILFSVKQFLEKSGLLTQEKADQQSAMFATDMNRDKALARRMDPDDGFSITDVKVWRQRNI